MAEIILGIGSSHTPQISMGANGWQEHAELFDARLPNFDTRKSQYAKLLMDEISEAQFADKYGRCQWALDHLATVLEEAEPDVVVVIGDDQKEVFLDDCTPSFAIYCGASITDRPRDVSKLNPPQLVAEHSYHGTTETSYLTAGEMARYAAQHMTQSGFDLAVVNALLPERTLGHAFTFVQRRLSKQPKWNLLPIWINTYYPPNQPSAARCYNFGSRLRELIEAWPEDVTVAVVASGGLSHFIIDEMLDRSLLSALERGDREALGSFSEDALQSGTSEIKNWIAAAGVLDGLAFELYDYVPAYRSLAGTGVGCAFGVWR